MERNETSDDKKSERRIVQPSTHLVRLTAVLTSSYVAHNQIRATELIGLIGALHAALASARSGVQPDQLKPAVPIKKSIADDYLICLEDGKKLTMLKRYLRSQYDMSPEQYRAKWGLPADYPMVAPAYARLRSAFAKKIGLGRTASPRRGRKRAKD